MAADSGMPSMSAPIAMALAESPCLSPGFLRRAPPLLFTALSAKKKATAPSKSPRAEASKPPIW